jgi:hypothetical protein
MLVVCVALVFGAGMVGISDALRVMVYGSAVVAGWISVAEGGTGPMEAVSVTEAVAVSLAVGVVVLLVVGVTDGLVLNCPIDDTTLIMVVLPSGMRAMLSPLFMVPKSMRSIWLPVLSSNTTASPVLLRMALLSGMTTSCCGAIVVPEAMMVTVPPGVSSSMRQPPTSTMRSLAL